MTETYISSESGQYRLSILLFFVSKKFEYTEQKVFLYLFCILDGRNKIRKVNSFSVPGEQYKPKAYRASARAWRNNITWMVLIMKRELSS